MTNKAGFDPGLLHLWPTPRTAPDTGWGWSPLPWGGSGAVRRCRTVPVIWKGARRPVG